MKYSLAAELEPAWAANLWRSTRQEGRTILVSPPTPAGEPLDVVLKAGGGAATRSGQLFYTFSAISAASGGPDTSIGAV